MVLKRNLANLLLAITGLLGCGSNEQTAPVVNLVCRATNSGECVSQAYAGEELDLLILGEHFIPRLTIDLGKDEPPHSDGEFLAWLGSLALHQVQPVLEPVLGRQTLSASLPGELAPGAYALQLQAPSGQRGARQDAFRLLNPLKVELSLTDYYLRAGDQTELQVTVSNLSSSPLSAVTLEIIQGDGGAVALPPAPAAFVLNGKGRHTATVPIRALQVGDVQLSVSVRCLAASSLPIETASPAQIKLQVQP